MNINAVQILALNLIPDPCIHYFLAIVWPAEIALTDGYILLHASLIIYDNCEVMHTICY